LGGKGTARGTDRQGNGPAGGAGAGSGRKPVRSGRAGGRVQSRSPGPTILRGGEARNIVELLPRGDGIHFHRLLSCIAPVLSDGKQSGLSSRRIQGSVRLFGR